MSTVGPVIIEFCEYWITNICIFISQLVDDMRTIVTRDARYYVQELNSAFKFSFGLQVDHLEPPVSLLTLIFSPETIQ